MIKYSLQVSNRYLKDLKLARKRGLDEQFAKNRNHALKGDYIGFWECHIAPDWLLIYQKDTTIKIISLYRTGTHSDLFD